MRILHHAFPIILLIVGTLPAELPKIRPALAKVPPLLDTGRVVVRVEKTRKSWRLLRGGRPYFIKGACVWGEQVRVEELKGAGANSMRTYTSQYAKWTLDQAHRRGMTVMLGFEASPERHGFLYTDPKDLEAQREKFRKFVLAYKDHPALLIWGIGNEVEQGMADPVHRERMWRELNYLALMAKKLDPNHPTSIILAGATKEKITEIRRFCPDVDIISINTYGGLRNHPEALNKWAWDKPYIIAEFGAYGWWEAKMTTWKAPIEQTSTEKAKEYLISYQRGIMRDRNRCLGSYVFFWHSKQEATATWFGMFLPSGERLEMVDAMTRAWSGQRPRNSSPQLKELKFAGEQDIFQSGEKVRVFMNASGPDKNPLRVQWKIMQESVAFTLDNAYGSVPQTLPENLITPLSDGAEFTVPKKPGGYRLFVFVYDGKGNAATGNLCFYSMPPPRWGRPRAPRAGL